MFTQADSQRSGLPLESQNHGDKSKKVTQGEAVKNENSPFVREQENVLNEIRSIAVNHMKSLTNDFFLL